MILESVSARYQFLPEDDIISALEQGATKALSHIFKRTGQASWDGRMLKMFLLGEHDLTELNPLDLTPHARRHLEWCIESELMRLNTIAEVDKIRRFEKMIVTGEIQKVKDSGSMDVWICLDEGGLTARHMLAHYPFKFQPQRERGRYKAGDTLNFMVASVRPIKERGNATKAHIVLTRTSKDFPAQMLMSIQDIKVKAISRVPGFRTLLAVKGKERPKKKHIIAVVKELGERLVFV